MCVQYVIMRCQPRVFYSVVEVVQYQEIDRTWYCWRVAHLLQEIEASWSCSRHESRLFVPDRKFPVEGKSVLRLSFTSFRSSYYYEYITKIFQIHGVAMPYNNKKRERETLTLWFPVKKENPFLLWLWWSSRIINQLTSLVAPCSNCTSLFFRPAIISTDLMDRIPKS